MRTPSPVTNAPQFKRRMVACALPSVTASQTAGFHPSARRDHNPAGGNPINTITASSGAQLQLDMMGGQLHVSHRAIGDVLRILPLALLLPAMSSNGQFVGSPLNCDKTCVCASNIISCSKRNLTSIPVALPRYTAVLDLSFNSIARLRAEWTTVKLSRLHSLLLSHNGLTFLSSEAFVSVTRLRYLDLSSNGLHLLEELIFEPLERLEVLLLYNNHISQIDRSAFSGLVSLQKLYLSHNQISRFPLELLKDRGRPETLTLLDVSSNRIKVLPLQDLQVLPAWMKNSLYFHNNSLPCSCELYNLLARWHLQQLSASTDFRDDHTCILPGLQKEKVAILDLNRIHFNCSEVRIMDEEAYLDQFLVLNCDTREKDVLKNWLLPGNVPVSPANKSAVMLEGGSLQIGPLKVDDSGVYTCYAASDSFNETLYVTVVVYNFTISGGLENMKTAYTTLLGCLASIVMVLIYLYLTPCHCLCCPDQSLNKSLPGDSLHSSTISVSQILEETGQDRGEVTNKGILSRHMALREPKDQQEQNGRLNPIGEEEEEWHMDNCERRRSDVESVSSVSSDTPMVV
ncbi:amphoterin-induced protein 1-like [Lampris incognitus]|uniref:amphoterin-induced protein 1-like n=1 Tax=Lampris incognitus TaxID=2546036 RepID=UPI0024B5FB91|nr:amphoterin-induced protein 1-like [Lampris incognitus]